MARHAKQRVFQLYTTDKGGTSIRLPENWEPIVRQMVEDQQGQVDPEAQRKEIRGTLRLMRENYERGLYDGEEYQYWQKVSGLKEKLALLEHVPESAITRAANTLLDLCETWKNTTMEERKDLVHVMLQEVGCDVAEKRVLWVKVRPDYEPLFGLLDSLHPDGELRYWIDISGTQGHNCGIGMQTGRVGTSVKTLPQVAHNALTSVEEYVQ